MNLWDRAAPAWSQIVWSLLRFCGIDLTPQEARQRRYENPEDTTNLEPQDIGDATTIEDLVKELFKNERDRREALDKKVSWLLTLSGILVPLSVNLVITSAGQLPLWFYFLALLFVTVPLLLSAVLLIEYFGVGNFSLPSIDEALLVTDSVDRKRIVLKSYLDATKFNGVTNHYLVDLYRAARRMFLAALTAIAVLGLVAICLLTWGNPARLEDRIIRNLRADPQMIELLRGPAGKTGPPGPRGERGDQGERGERGESGPGGGRELRQPVPPDPIKPPPQ